MRNMVARVVFNMTDAGQIRRTREMITTAVSRFQVYILIFVSSLVLRLLLGSFSYKDERTFTRSCGKAARTIRGNEKSQQPTGGGGRGRRRGRRGRRGRGILSTSESDHQAYSGIRRPKLSGNSWRFAFEQIRKYDQL